MPETIGEFIKSEANMMFNQHAVGIVSSAMHLLCGIPYKLGMEGLDKLKQKIRTSVGLAEIGWLLVGLIGGAIYGSMVLVSALPKLLFYSWNRLVINNLDSLINRKLKEGSFAYYAAKAALILLDILFVAVTLSLLMPYTGLGTALGGFFGTLAAAGSYLLSGIAAAWTGLCGLITTAGAAATVPALVGLTAPLTYKAAVSAEQFDRARFPEPPAPTSAITVPPQAQLRAKLLATPPPSDTTHAPATATPNGNQSAPQYQHPAETPTSSSAPIQPHA